MYDEQVYEVVLKEDADDRMLDVLIQDGVKAVKALGELQEKLCTGIPPAPLPPPLCIIMSLSYQLQWSGWAAPSEDLLRVSRHSVGLLGTEPVPRVRRVDASDHLATRVNPPPPTLGRSTANCQQ